MKSITVVLLATSLLVGAGPALTHVGDRDRGHGPPGHGPRGPEAMEMIGHLHHALKRLDLSEVQREAIKEDFRAMRDELEPFLEQLREGRAAMHKALLAQDFDEGSVAAIAEQQGSTNAEIIQIVARSVHSALSQLTPEQRAELMAMQDRHREKMARRLEHLQQRLGDGPDIDD